jgi:aryl-alcohol dehydrogenase-like predicted oxidoreductase
MRYKQLGRTGLFVSEICLGAMTFGAGKEGVWGNMSGLDVETVDSAMGALDQPTVDRILAGALSAGVNFVDTADVYAGGQSELRVGRALKNLGVKRKDIVIATKVFNPVGPGPNDRGASRGHIMDAVRDSLDRLGTDYIDLYQIHGYDRVTPLEETLRALEDLRRQGLVRYLGVSNWQAYKIAKALGISEARGLTRFETLQAHYSIATRDIERELVPLINEDGLGLMVWSPLAGGLLTGKYGPDVESPRDSRLLKIPYPPVDQKRAWACVAAMREVAKEHGVSVARIALAWLLAKPHVMSVIIGARTEDQLADNLAVTALVLSAEEVARLDEVGKLSAEYPTWSISFRSVDRVPAPFRPKN